MIVRLIITSIDTVIITSIAHSLDSSDRITQPVISARHLPMPRKQTKTQCYALTKTCLITEALATITQALGHQQTALYWPNRLLTLSRGLPALLIFSAGLGRLSATSPAFLAALPTSGASTSVALLIPAVAPGACCPAVLGFGRLLLSRGEVICSANKTKLP